MFFTTTEVSKSISTLNNTHPIIPTKNYMLLLRPCLPKAEHYLHSVPICIHTHTMLPEVIKKEKSGAILKL